MISAGWSGVRVPPGCIAKWLPGKLSSNLKKNVLFVLNLDNSEGSEAFSYAMSINYGWKLYKRWSGFGLYIGIGHGMFW